LQSTFEAGATESMTLLHAAHIAVVLDRRAFIHRASRDGFWLRCRALWNQIWIFRCHSFTVCRGDEAVICGHENQR
jgi:hypothetical protein